jgi:hypothetical protein
MNIIEAINKLKAQRFEPYEHRCGEMMLIPVDGYIQRASGDASITIEGFADKYEIDYTHKLPLRIERLTAFGRGGYNSRNDEWLVIDASGLICVEDILATDWEFMRYEPETEEPRIADPNVELVLCKRDCPYRGKDGCEVSADYIQRGMAVISVSCPLPWNKKIIAETVEAQEELCQ